MTETNFGKIMGKIALSADNDAMHPENNTETIRELHEVIEEKWDQRVARKTKEERSKRVTFQMDLDLIERLDKIAKRKYASDGKPGFKTMALNAMIRRCLNEYEQ